MWGGGSRAQGVTGGVLVLVAIVVIAWSWQLPGGTKTDPVGPRGFPVLLGLGILACGAALLVPARFPATSLDAGARSGGAAADDDGPVAPGRLVGGIVLTGLYIALLERLGYLVATALFLVAVLTLQGGVPRRTFVLTALGLPVALFLLFAWLMKVPLPLGLLEGLLRPGLF